MSNWYINQTKFLITWLTVNETGNYFGTLVRNANDPDPAKANIPLIATKEELSPRLCEILQQDVGYDAFSAAAVLCEILKAELSNNHVEHDATDDSDPVSSASYLCGIFADAVASGFLNTIHNTIVLSDDDIYSAVRIYPICASPYPINIAA